jgi:hypothetical protein
VAAGAAAVRSGGRGWTLWLGVAVCAALVGLVMIRLTRTAAPELHPEKHQDSHPPGVPDWVPVYPGAAATVDVSNQFPEREEGSFHFVTAAGVDKVAEFYRSALPSAGLKVNGDVPGQVNDGTGRILTADDGHGRRLTLAIGERQTNVSFEARK